MRNGQRLEFYVLVNKIKDNKEEIFLLTLISSESYKVLKSLCTPTFPKNVEYTKLIPTEYEEFIFKKSLGESTQSLNLCRMVKISDSVTGRQCVTVTAYIT